MTEMLKYTIQAEPTLQKAIILHIHTFQPMWLENMTFFLFSPTLHCEY